MGELIEDDRSKVTAYLSQQPGEQAAVMLSVGHRTAGSTVPLSTHVAARLAGRLVALLSDADAVPDPPARGR